MNTLLFQVIAIFAIIFTPIFCYSKVSDDAQQAAICTVKKYEPEKLYGTLPFDCKGKPQVFENMVNREIEFLSKSNLIPNFSDCRKNLKEAKSLSKLGASVWSMKDSEILTTNAAIAFSIKDLCKNNFASNSSIPEVLNSLGLEKIQSPADFSRVLGSCIREKQSAADSALPKAASICVARNVESCSRSLKVKECRLIRMAFDNSENPVWAFLSLGGMAASSKLSDTFNAAFGKQEPVTRQANGSVIFSQRWSTEKLQLEQNFIYSPGKNDSDNSSLVWIVNN